MAAETRYTVTYLEMTAPPGKPPPTRPAEPLTLMAASQPPVHYFRYLYDAVGGDYQWTDLHAWPSEKLAGFVQHPAVHMMVLYRRGAPGGFYLLDRREPRVCDLAYFGLTPEARGRKIGRWLLWTAIQEAWDAPAQSGHSGPIEKMTVNTCTLDHPSALSLYQRMGFAPCRREERDRGR